MFSVIGQISRFLYNLLTALLKWIFSLFSLNPEFLTSARFKDSVEYFFTDTIVIFLMIIAITFVVSIIRAFFRQKEQEAFRGQKKPEDLSAMLRLLFWALQPLLLLLCRSCLYWVYWSRSTLGNNILIPHCFAYDKEVAVTMLWALLGWKIAMLYMATGLTVAIIAGAIIGKLKMEKYLEEDVFCIKIGDVEIVKPSWKQRITDAWSYALDLVKKIWPYIIVGLVIEAAIHGWAPGDWLGKYAGRSNPFAVPIAVLLGIPLYSNAAGTLLLSASLLSWESLWVRRCRL